MYILRTCKFHFKLAIQHKKVQNVQAQAVMRKTKVLLIDLSLPLETFKFLSWLTGNQHHIHQASRRDNETVQTQNSRLGKQRIKPLVKKLFSRNFW